MDTIRLSSEEAIRRAAIEVFSANPGASLAEVAARAGVGRATLHRHFPSRDDLIRDLSIAALDATDAAVAGLDEISREDADRALTLTFERLIPLADQYTFLARISLPDPEVDRRYDAQVAGLGKLVRDLKEQGLVDPLVPDAWATSLIDMLIWTTWGVAAEGGVSAKEATALATRTFLRGIAPAGGKR